MNSFISIDNQINKLKNKGIIIDDMKLATRIIEKCGYFNIINAYKTIFKKETETSFNNVNFMDFYVTYNFDKSLRNILLKYILIAENNVKSIISYEYSKLYSINGYLNYKNYDITSPDRKFLVIETINQIVKSINKDSLNIQNHYFKRNQDVPIWCVMDMIDFGTMRKFYQNISLQARTLIAKHFKVGPKVFISMLSCINMYRNVCAHNNRLYGYKINDNNKQLADIDILYKMHISRTKNNIFKFGKTDLFCVFVALKYILDKQTYSAFIDEVLFSIDTLENGIKSKSAGDILKAYHFPFSNEEGQLDWFKIKDL